MKNAFIISNNILSETKNNGKTILSFFKNFDDINLFQLYFSSEEIEYKNAKYFKISDKDVISIKKKENVKTITTTKNNIKPNAFLRLIRDILWLLSFRYKRDIIKFYEKSNPDFIFFVAGDFLFPYLLIPLLLKIKKVPVIVFITDDYILKYPEDTVIEKIRKKYIRYQLHKILNFAKYVFVISKKMKLIYDEIFKIDSKIFLNIFKGNSNNDSLDVYKIKEYNFIYAGSMHTGRKEELIEFAKFISELNKDLEEKFFLDVYSNETICEDNPNIRNHGYVNSEELMKAYEETWAFIFVESTDKKNIQKTNLSLSTKVPEYLSYSKPIFYIGNKESYSVEYLSKIGFNVDTANYLRFKKDIVGIMNRKIYAENAQNSQKLYKQNHNYDLQIEKLRRIFEEV